MDRTFIGCGRARFCFLLPIEHIGNLSEAFNITMGPAVHFWTPEITSLVLMFKKLKRNSSLVFVGRLHRACWAALSGGRRKKQGVWGWRDGSQVGCPLGWTGRRVSAIEMYKLHHGTVSLTAVPSPGRLGGPRKHRNSSQACNSPPAPWFQKQVKAATLTQANDIAWLWASHSLGPAKLKPSLECGQVGGDGPLSSLSFGENLHEFQHHQDLCDLLLRISGGSGTLGQPWKLGVERAWGLPLLMCMWLWEWECVRVLCVWVRVWVSVTVSDLKPSLTATLPFKGPAAGHLSTPVPPHQRKGHLSLGSPSTV